MSLRLALVGLTFCGAYVAAVNLCALAWPVGVVAILVTVFSISPALRWVRHDGRI